jgi:hypothetical protein
VPPLRSGPPQDLLGPPPEVGQVYRTEWKVTIFKATIAVTEAGRSDKAHCDMLAEATEEEEILALADGKLTKCRIRIEKDETRMTIREGLQKDSRVDRSPLADETIEFEKVGEEWKKSLVGKTANAQEVEELNLFPPPVCDAEVYPDQPVKPCHRWDLDVKRVYGVMRHVFDVESGTCTRKFEKMIDWNGESCARIAQDLELHGRMRAEKGQWLHCDLKISGSIERAISRGFTVGCQMKGTMTLSGTISEGGKELQSTITRPIELEWKTERK